MWNNTTVGWLLPSGDNCVENEILELLKSMQSSINELKDGQQETNKRLDRIEKKLDSVHEQTAHTMEDITEIKLNTSKDISSLVNVTSRNCYDITELKSKIN